MPPTNSSNPNDLHNPTPQTDEHIITPTPQSSSISPDQPTAQPPAQSSQPKKRKVLKWVGIFVVLVFVAAAAILLLSGKNENKKQPVTQNQKKDVPVLRVGYLSGPLNGIYPGGFEASSNFLETNFQLFEGLVSYKDKTKIVPQLATGWSNPSSTTWVFDIRPNVKFHTGRTMTNTDVKASLDAAKANPDLEIYTSSLKNIETVGTDKIKITTNVPDTILLNKLTYLFVYDTKSVKKDDPINGTGPYVIKPDTTLKEDDLDFVAVNDYHGGHVAVKELKMHWYKDTEQAVQEFNKGNVDILGNLDQATLKQLKNYDNYKVPIAGTRYLNINNAKDKSPLQKLQFRQGLEYLLDKQAIMNKEQGGGVVANQFIPVEIPGYDPSVKPRNRDVTKAKELFAAAGYPNGATLHLIYSQLDPSLIKTVQDQLAEGGIKTTTEDINDFDEFLHRVEVGNFEIAFESFVTDFQDGSDFVGYVEDSSHYKNAEVDKLVASANQTLDQPTRLASLKKASQQLTNDTPIVPIYYLRDNYAIKKGQNYQLHPDTFQTAIQVYYWKVYQK